MKLKFKNYSIEDFATEKSFINYCLSSDEKDVDFWNEWLLNHPDRTTEINEARALVLKYSLALPEPELSQERNRFISELNSSAGENQEVQAGRSASMWSYVGRVAAVLLLGIGLGLTFKFSTENDPQIDKPISRIIKQNPAGQKSTIYLSDGTKVILNAKSRMEYDEGFGGEKREVTLVGEAFFEVTKDPEKPFVVRSGDIVTTVLGTSFNVNAYPEASNVQVAVMTGKVRVENKLVANNDQNARVDLVPSEMATYDTNNNTLTPSSFSPEEVISWKDGIIYFKNADEPSVLAKLEKWYGVEIDTENKSPRLWNITAEYDNLSLDNVLSSLSYAANFDYTIDKKKVTLKY